MKKFAVIGNPIEQSKSPVIHQAFAQQAGFDINYQKKLVANIPGEFKKITDKFFEDGGTGLNITAPFKFNAFEYASEISERAQLAEAVNTLAVQDNGRILGDNTDSVGLLNDVQNRLSWTIKNQRLLFIGAGGAVRGVLFPFLSAQPSVLVVANRTVSKAEALQEKFNSYGPIQGLDLEALAEQKAFDIVINGSSAGLNKHTAQALPPNCYHETTRFYDMSYANEPTPFLRWVIEHTNRSKEFYSDGLGMLVGQAAESFRIWTGYRPEVEPVMAQLQTL